MLQSDVAQQRVFIVGDGSLFDEGVTQLLADDANLVVSRAIYSDNLAIQNMIDRDQPDVILVCESCSQDTARILDLAASHPKSMGLRIVVIRLSNNVVDEYERPIFVEEKISYNPRKIIVKTGNQLINTVRRKHNEHQDSRSRIPS